MNAKEARDTALRVLNPEIKRQYDEIKILIDKRSNAGDMSCTFNEDVYPRVRILLEFEGFRPHSFGEKHNIISW